MPDFCPYFAAYKKNIRSKINVCFQCTAFIPPFKLNQKAGLCKKCTILETLRQSKCAFLRPLALKSEKVVYFCTGTMRKFLNPTACLACFCERYRENEETRKSFDTSMSLTE